MMEVLYMQIILKVESLKKYYGKEPNLTKALDGISFQVIKGEFLGIMAQEKLRFLIALQQLLSRRTV